MDQRFVPSRLLFAAALSVVTSSAQAQDNAMVLGQSLALAGCLGGTFAGTVAAFLSPRPVRFWASFGVYLGALCVAASTWAGTMDIVPLALVLGAASGLLPYAACFLLARRALLWLGARLRRRGV